MKFKRKSDWWLYATAALPLYLILSALINKNNEVFASGIILLFIAAIIVIPVFFLTEYNVENGELKIKSGLFYKKIIPAKDIKTIAPTHNPLSSAAVSSNRIAIYYKKNQAIKTAFISPADKDGFIKALLKENQNIIIKMIN